MTRILRTARMSFLCTFIALVTFSFLAVGSASAHTLNHPAGFVQTGSSSSTTFVHIKSSQSSRAAFNPSAITVKSGTPVKIINKTVYSLLLFISQGDVILSPGASTTVSPTQSQVIRICAGGALTITVV